MEDILLRRALVERGYSGSEIERMRRAGQLDRVRRGAYAPPDPTRSAEERHRQLVLATVAQLRADAVVSHASAAVLHQLPVWSDALSRVHLTRPRRGGGKLRTLVEIHASVLAPDETVVLGGIAVTSLARTVLDLGRTLPLEQGVAAADAALRQGVSRGELEEVLARCPGWPGVGRARQVLALMDARSESAGESASRVRLRHDGLPVPELQHPVTGPGGALVGRADFAWLEQRTLGEFDGRVKYGRLLRPGQPIEEVIYQEKLREDALRDLGWQVVRWTWADLYRPGVVADRLWRAFARSAR